MKHANRFPNPEDLLSRVISSYESYEDIKKEKVYLKDPSNEQSEIEITNYKEQLQDILTYNKSLLRFPECQKVKNYAKIRNSMRRAFADIAQKFHSLSFCELELNKHLHTCTDKCIYWAKKNKNCILCDHSRYIPINSFVETLEKVYFTRFKIKGNLHETFINFASYDEKLSVKIILAEAEDGAIIDLCCISYLDITGKTKFNPSEVTKVVKYKDIFYPSQRKNTIHEDILQKPIGWSEQDIKLLNNQICKVAHNTSKYKKNEKARDSLLRYIELAAEKSSKAHDIVRVTIFGSQATGLSNQNSDYDVSLLVFTNEGEPKTLDKKFILNMTSRLKAKKIRAIPIFAKVPIIKLTYSFEGKKLNADISFGNTSGIIKSMMLQFYSKMLPKVKNLLLCLKSWANNRMIVDGSKYLNSFGYSLLLLSYLAELGVIVPFKMLAEQMLRWFIKSNNLFASTSDKWYPLAKKFQTISLGNDHESGTEQLKDHVLYCVLQGRDPHAEISKSCEHITSIKQSQTEAELLIGFFRYFGFEHNYISSGVNFELGTCKKPTNSDLGRVLDPDFAVNGKILQLDDPVDLHLNNARNLKVQNLDMILSEMRRAYFILNFGHNVIAKNTHKLVDIALQRSKHSYNFSDEFWFHEYRYYIRFVTGDVIDDQIDEDELVDLLTLKLLLSDQFNADGPDKDNLDYRGFSAMDLNLRSFLASKSSN